MPLTTAQIAARFDRKWTESDLSSLRTLMESGHSFMEVAALTQRTPDAVAWKWRQLRRRLGLPIKSSREPLADRFWKAVPVRPGEGCWLWRGSMGADGYGRISIKRRNLVASRVSWELAHGAPPEAGLLVCHHCDTPACVRPSHLFLGSQAENMRDAKRKGRVAVGQRVASAKLTPEQVLDIRSKVGRVQDIAASFGVSVGLVSGIKNGKIWAHLGEVVE